MNMDYDYVITKPDLNEETLAHYGVKGMKWRRHKIKTASKGTTKYNYLNDLYKTDHPSFDLLNNARDDLYKYLYDTKPGFRKVYDFMHTPVTDLAKNAARKVAKAGNSLTGIQAYAQTNSSGGGHDRSVPSGGSNGSSKNRPVSRKKNTNVSVNSNYEDPNKKKTVKKKGSGLGTGKVGR